MKRALAVLTVSCLAAAPLAAGVVYEIEVKDHDASPPTTETSEVAVEGKNLKMEIAAGAGSKGGEAIYRGDRREMIVVDHDDKSYVVLDDATLRQIGGMANEAMKQMEEALKNVPEDRRAMIEQMMKENMPDAGAAPGRPATEVRKTSERATKNGYPCVKYEVFQAGRKVRELWVTDWDNIEGAGDVRGAFEDMAAFFQELLDSLPKMPGSGGLVPGGGGGNFITEMKELDGFPVAGSEFGEDGSLEEDFSLRSAQRRTLDPADFEPPAGYKRRSMLPTN